MNNKISYLIFFILFLPALAEATSFEYQGWIYNNKYITIDNINHKILISQEGESVLIKADTFSTTLNLNECIDSDYKRYCYNLSTFDKEVNDYKAYIYVYSVKPDIKITRTLTQNILAVGESATFKVTLKNEGDADASQVIFTEMLPENINIERAKGATIQGKNVVWEGSLDKDELYEIEYVIKSIGEVDKYVKASVKYFDGLAQQEIFSEQIRLYSAAVLSVTLRTDKEDYEIGEKIKLNVTVSNRADKTIDVTSLKFIFPEEVEIKEKSSSIRDSEYVWSRSLEPNQTETISFSLLPKKNGMFFIIVNGEYEYSGKELKIGNLKQGFLVHNDGIEISTSLSDNQRVSSNQFIIIYLRVKNNNEFTKIKNVEVNTTTDLAYFEKAKYGSIESNQTVFLINNEIRIPSVSSEKTYSIKFNVTYKTEDNQTFSESLEKKIIVVPSKLLTIIPSLSSNNIIEEQEVTINLNLKNSGMSDLKDVLIKTEIPEEFIVKGATSASVLINKSKEEKILSFILIPKVVDKEKILTINFTAKYEEDGNEYYIMEQKKVTVSPKKPKVNIQKVIPQTTVYQGELIDVNYIITNEDTLPIFNLVLESPKAQNFDNLNVFTYNISQLNPGEKITIKAEQIRPKKKDYFNTEKATLFYQDKHSRSFNQTSGGISLTIKEAEIKGPSVYIEKSISKKSLIIGETAILTINLTNLGVERAIGFLDNGRDEIILPFYETKILNQNLSFEREGRYVIPKSVFFFNYLNNEVRAYSNEIEIIVLNSSSSVKVEIPNEEKDSTDKGESPQKEEIKKKNFFENIYLWFIRLFKKV